MLASLFRAAERAALAAAALGLVALILFAGATLVNGVSRSLFEHPFDVVGDGASLVVAASVASCFPLAILRRSNITIDLLTGAIPPASARALGRAADVLVLVVMGAMARQLFVYAANAARAGDSTAMLDIPTAPFWFYVAAMLATATLMQALLIAADLGAGLRRHGAEIHP